LPRILPAPGGSGHLRVEFRPWFASLGRVATRAGTNCFYIRINSLKLMSLFQKEICFDRFKHNKNWKDRLSFVLQIYFHIF
jgi:hypothetical protein